jgi:hypothetical protein
MFLSKLHNNGAGSEFLPETNFDKKNFLNFFSVGPEIVRIPNVTAFETGVARWYIFKPKIQILVNFGGP